MAPAPSPPAQAVTAALRGNERFGSLLQRVQDSRALLAQVSGALPAGLRDVVRAGPLDDTSWELLVAHAAAAAKLRQLLPTIEARLRDQGCTLAVRVKVLPRQA